MIYTFNTFLALQKFSLDAYCNEAMLSDKAVYKELLQMTDLISVNNNADAKVKLRVEIGSILSFKIKRNKMDM